MTEIKTPTKARKADERTPLGRLLMCTRAIYRSEVGRDV